MLLLFLYAFFHNLGVKRTKIGKISNLPASIMIDKISFEKFEKKAKFSVGPTKLNPGPTLLIHVNTEVKLERRSTFSILIINVPNKTMKK